MPMGHIQISGRVARIRLNRRFYLLDAILQASEQFRDYVRIRIEESLCSHPLDTNSYHLLVLRARSPHQQLDRSKVLALCDEISRLSFSLPGKKCQALEKKPVKRKKQ